jgi:hypothetical protein
VIDINTQRMLARDQQLCGDAELVQLRSNISAAIDDIHTCCPGIVDAFDAETQMAQVKPALQHLFFPDGEDARWVDLPPLVDVPVVVLGGAGFALTFPIHSGDECLLLFAERSIDNWRETGEVSQQALARHHSLSDAFALVGIRSQGRALSSYNPAEVELRSLDGQTKIRLTDSGEIFLHQGGNQIQMSGGQITLVAPTVRIEGQLTVTGTVNGITVQSHIHGGVQGGGSYTGPPQ